jgi:NAD+ diphosphatase
MSDANIAAAPERLVVGIVVRFGHSVLLARHRYHDEKRFALIAGFVETGESIEAAANREVSEETGLRVRIEERLGEFDVTSREDGPVHFVVVQAWADSARVSLNDELDEAIWFSLGQLPEMPPVVAAVQNPLGIQPPHHVC